MPRSDEEYIRCCLNDHPEAFRHLVRRYEIPLTRYLQASLGNAEDAAEAAQETFVRAYFALGKLRNSEAFLSWLLGIAERVVKETWRAARRSQSVDDGEVELAGASAPRETADDIATAEAVARLPSPYREVILSRYYAGHSCAEISRDLGVPVGTVTKRLSRAYALLREHLSGKLCRVEDEVPR